MHVSLVGERYPAEDFTLFEAKQIIWNVSPVEQIRWVFDDNEMIIFVNSP